VIPSAEASTKVGPHDRMIPLIVLIEGGAEAKQKEADEKDLHVRRGCGYSENSSRFGITYPERRPAGEAEQQMGLNPGPE